MNASPFTCARMHLLRWACILERGTNPIRGADTTGVNPARPIGPTRPSADRPIGRQEGRDYMPEVSVVANADAAQSTVPRNPYYERRWLALGVVVIAQIMILLDATVVNVALPSAQAHLGFSDANRQWVITAYVLAFGSLLPLGGRLAD